MQTKYKIGAKSSTLIYQRKNNKLQLKHELNHTKKGN